MSDTVTPSLCPSISDTAGLLALVTGERETRQGQVAFLQKTCPRVKYRVSSVMVKHKGTKWRSMGLG